jgi:hypothetical protein
MPIHQFYTRVWFLKMGDPLILKGLADSLTTSHKFIREFKHDVNWKCELINTGNFDIHAKSGG